VTVTLEIDTSHLKVLTTSLHSHLVNQVLQGHQPIKVLELQPINIHEEIRYNESFYWAPGNMRAVHQADVVYLYSYT
jgi:hypothetical protein